MRNCRGLACRNARIVITFISSFIAIAALLDMALNDRVIDQIRSRIPSYHPFRDVLEYRPPNDPWIQGERFSDVDKSVIESLLPDPVILDENNINDFVFVSAVSSGFFPRLTLLVQSIQTKFPNKKLIIYDLGVTEEQLSQMKRWCHVEVRKFAPDKYPLHVRNLHSYAFKPIIISEVLRSYKGSGIFWIDASVRFTDGDISTLFHLTLRSGICAFQGTKHSVYSVTPTEMFQLLPMASDPMKECFLGGILLVYKTKYVIENILQWWLACALSRTCIYSRTNLNCAFKDRWKDFGYCSRFDQSAISILLYNAFENITDIIGPEPSRRGVLYVQRGGSGGRTKSCALHNGGH